MSLALHIVLLEHIMLGGKELWKPISMPDNFLEKLKKKPAIQNYKILS